MDDAKALLDELMGKHRDVAPADAKDVHWSDKEFCRFYLCGLCPHDLFSNTKSDLGPCHLEHSDKMKEMYEKSSKFGRMGYEQEHCRYLESLTSKVDRRVTGGNERLKEPLPADFREPLSAADQQRADMLGEQINHLLGEMARLGEEGKVDQSQALMQRVEVLKRQQQEIMTQTTGLADKIKQMEMCPICGAYLVVGELQNKMDSHLQGKQHIGYAMIRNKVTEYKEKFAAEKYSSNGDKRESSSSRRDDDRKDRDRSRDRDRERERERERDRGSDRRRDDDRDRYRDSRYSSRSDRDRDRDRRHSSSSYRDRRDRSRSRDRR